MFKFTKNNEIGILKKREPIICNITIRLRGQAAPRHFPMETSETFFLLREQREIDRGFAEEYCIRRAKQRGIINHTDSRNDRLPVPGSRGIPGRQYSSLAADVAYRTASIYRRATRIDLIPPSSLNRHIRSRPSLVFACASWREEINAHRRRGSRQKADPAIRNCAD